MPYRDPFHPGAYPPGPGQAGPYPPVPPPGRFREPAELFPGRQPASGRMGQPTIRVIIQK